MFFFTHFILGDKEFASLFFDTTQDELGCVLSLPPAQDGLVRLASALNEPIAGGRDKGFQDR